MAIPNYYYYPLEIDRTQIYNHIGLRLLEATIIRDILISHIHAGDKPTLEVPIANGHYLSPVSPRTIATSIY
jgi:hypothetical protein